MEGVIIVAGGRGKRMLDCFGADAPRNDDLIQHSTLNIQHSGTTFPKQFRMLGSLPVLGHTINAFAQALAGAPLIVVLPADRIDFWKNLAARFPIARHTCVAGGAERFHSVQNGLAAMPHEVALIAVHDGARSLVSRELIRRAVACAAEHGTAVPVVEVVDSLREVLPEDTSRAVDRRPLRIVQTPQVFAAWMLHEAYRTEFDPTFTDDASVIERAGHAVTLCAGERANLKITVEEDLAIANTLLDCFAASGSQ